MELGINDLTVDVFLDLYTSVGWEPPLREQVETALRGSIAAFTAMEGGQAVGMVRLIGDGGMSFYIKDFAVRPSWQGKGIGSVLIHALEEYIRENISPGWAVSLELISTIEAVSFYRKMGFEERPCDWDGPGMFKMLR
jgi:GNAT superfamily N-acetyltransferase